MLNPLRWPFRLQCLAGLLTCIGLLAYALYAQHVMFLDPCPLCILQRIAFMIMGVGFLGGLLHGPQGRGGRLGYAGVVLLGGAMGLAVAGRHLWLQSLPADQVPACGPGLAYMMEAFPLKDVLLKVFAGSGECAKVDWHFLGIAMPGWTLICYLLLAGGMLWVALRRA